MLAPLSFAASLSSATKLISHSSVGFTISDKIKKIAIPCFKAATSLYFFTFGGSELAQNLIKKNIKIQTDTSEFKKILPLKSYLNLHGVLMFGSGIFCLIDALDEFGVNTLGYMANIASLAGSVLFLCANIIALEENVRLIQVLKETDWSKTNIDEKELDWLKRSSFFGAVSNIGYIIATASLLFSGATTAAIVIAVLSCCAGGIKILSDLMVWAKQYNYV